MKKIALLAALIISGMLMAWFVNKRINTGNVNATNATHSNHAVTTKGKSLHTGD